MIDTAADAPGNCIHFENEAAIRRHFGNSLDRRTPYDRAWAVQEEAVARAGKSRKIIRFEPARLRKDPTYAHAWPSHRIDEWTDADRRARLAGIAAREDSKAVKAIRKLADQLRESGSLRDYAKAVAARIALEIAVETEAYGRAMPKEWCIK